MKKYRDVNSSFLVADVFPWLTKNGYKAALVIGSKVVDLGKDVVAGEVVIRVSPGLRNREVVAMLEDVLRMVRPEAERDPEGLN